MSAPDTNTKKQAKRHRGPLIGIAVALLVAGVLLFWMLSQTLVVEPDPPAEVLPEEAAESELGGSVPD